MRPEWLTNANVQAIAEEIERTGDATRLPILADAMQDAGAPDEDQLVYYCRIGKPAGACKLAVYMILGTMEYTTLPLQCFSAFWDAETVWNSLVSTDARCDGEPADGCGVSD